ncbi:MAG TPA: ABC transporter permease [Alphaproteobacteria bacterium]|nr:ABC transporter permease [Alphaproteobacteria bacterium]
MSYSRAANDLAGGLRAWRLWSRLAWHDIRGRYRRSVLGPFWLTLTMAAVAVSLGLLYSRVFGREIAQYLPYICAGLIVWDTVARLLDEGCRVFLGSAHLIQSMRLDYSVLLYRLLLDVAIVFLHQIVVLVAVLAWFGQPPTAATLLALPALALVLANGLWAALLLGLLCTRFRDVENIVRSVTRLAVFLTPVFWYVEDVGRDSGWVAWNPFYYLLELLRQPLLGRAPDPALWVAAAGAAAVGGGLAFLAFAHMRRRVVYWL